MSDVRDPRTSGPEPSVEGRALAAVSEALVGAATDLSLDAVLERLVRAARDLVGARYAALGVPDGDGGFARFITTGMDEELVERLGPLPRTHGLLDAMLTQSTPYRTPDIRRDPRFRGWWPAEHPEMRSFLGYPIVFKGDVIGAFYLTEKVGADSFDETDEHLVGVFAPHAAVLVEYARLYEQSRELSVAGERNRIARELHDSLTQTLFAARLALKTATLALSGDGHTPSGTARPEVTAALEQIDRATALVNDAFGELRALILDLRPPDLEADRLSGAVRKQLALVERTSDLAVDLRFDGLGDLDVAAERAAGDDGGGEEAGGVDALDELVEPEAERQILRIVQEAVANVVRHAGARTLAVSLALDPAGGGGERPVLRLEVRDDGRGFDPGAPGIRSRRLGLTSMLERARALGGRLAIESSPGAGTVVRAEVPLG